MERELGLGIFKSMVRVRTEMYYTNYCKTARAVRTIKEGTPMNLNHI